MRIIPVIDLLDGVVVRGVGGLRDQYRPIESQLVDSTEPLAIAEALRARQGDSYIYVADLDAIRSGTLSREVIQSLTEAGFELLLDAGAFQYRQVELLLGLGVTDVVVGLETLVDPSELKRAVDRFGERVVFSLDLKANWPLTADRSPWRDMPPNQIVDEAVQLGVQRMIVLDLHNVGRNAGLATLQLCRDIRRRHADVGVITGGGVRIRDDLAPLDEAGIEGVMIASALHDGRI